MANQRTNNRIDPVYKRILLYRLCMAFVVSRSEKAYVEALNNYHNKNYDVTATNYYHNAPMPMGMVNGSGTTAVHQLFSYDSSGNVVSVDYSSDGGSTFATYYYVRNSQNDVVKLIDSSGATVVEYAYDTWGKLLSTTGSLASTLGANQPFRYRGYVYDTETGCYYLQSRYYDPSIGRFISADVLLSTGQGVLGHNAFAYCLNNPVNLADASGCIPYVNNYMMTDSAGANPDPFLNDVNTRPSFDSSEHYALWKELDQYLSDQYPMQLPERAKGTILYKGSTEVSGHLMTAASVAIGYGIGTLVSSAIPVGGPLLAIVLDLLVAFVVDTMIERVLLPEDGTYTRYEVLYYKETTQYITMPDGTQTYYRVRHYYFGIYYVHNITENVYSFGWFPLIELSGPAC